MIIITGGAGFIGSALVAALNKRGKTDLLIVDQLDHIEKEGNLAALLYERMMDGAEFRRRLAEGEFTNQNIEAVFHLAAITSTTENNWELFTDVNIAFSQEVIRWCVDRRVRCIYISSAAAYGDGLLGYNDDHALFDRLRPLNLYGRSKLMVDIWARDAGYLDEIVGLRYFNVFGPNEYHKEAMRSVVARQFEQIIKGNKIKLFKSNHPDYDDGEQRRDFIYVKDAVKATLFFLDQPKATGVFNIGTGVARSWNDLARAIYVALGREPQIEYVDMPPELAKQYQNFSQADMTKLLAAGYQGGFMSLEEAITDYVRNYLMIKAHIASN